MKKIGIITFHNALSYGAALQSYALQNFLLSNGIKNEIIDYECDFINKKYKKLLSIDKNNIPKSFVGSVLKAGNKRKSLMLSKQFQKNYMKLSNTYNRHTVSNIKDKYAAFISGSDQVWSPTCAGFDKTYLLDFADGTQKYSYAASFGTDTLPNEKLAEYKRLLSDFSAVSVREQSGEKIINNLIKRDAVVNIDPTLLLKKEDWDKIAVAPKIKGPYILLFNVLKPVRMIEYAVKLGKEKHLPVYYLNDMHFPKREGITYLDPVAPNEFVGLIKNAEYVVTNSFHGNAFSLIYEKKFVMELDTCSKRNNRSAELLKKLGIENKEIKDEISPDADSFVDFNNVKNILDEERKKSLNYFLAMKSNITE